jgi:hypothetical protein
MHALVRALPDRFGNTHTTLRSTPRRELLVGGLLRVEDALIGKGLVRRAEIGSGAALESALTFGQVPRPLPPNFATFFALDCLLPSNLFKLSSDFGDVILFSAAIISLASTCLHSRTALTLLNKVKESERGVGVRLSTLLVFAYFEIAFPDMRCGRGDIEGRASERGLNARAVRIRRRASRMVARSGDRRGWIIACRVDRGATPPPLSNAVCVRRMAGAGV